MRTKAGKITLPASGSFSVSGLGFEPQLVLFIYADLTVEDSWVTTGFGNGGMGCASRASDGGSIVNSCANNAWGGGTIIVSSTYLTSINAWARSSHGGGGWAIFVSSFDADGFTMNFASGFASGASGKIVYYLAFGECDHVGQNFFWSDGLTKDFGFNPGVLFSMASGGRSKPGAANSGVTFADSDYAGWAVSYIPTVEERGTQMSQAIESSQPLNGGWTVSSLNLVLVKAKVAGLFQFDTAGVGLDVDGGSVMTAGIDSSSGARFSAHVLGGVIGDGGAATPSGDVDGEVEVSFPFDEAVAEAITPEAVVFLCHQEPANDDGGDTKGGRSIGFLTEDFQCVVAWGGDRASSTARFVSSDRAWVSNFVDPTMGADVSAGQATLLPSGFRLTTKENGKAMQSVNWVAYGPVSEEELAAAGFVTRYRFANP